ncbi:hypothetical protein [Aridibaculum aurantiacum]|uniref:hypothetical protein n=1 Tax=Aridibaculum aurantiacum TaxID=2810307 RepID=UPI001A964615|nr:hypothetical protein [Aridibaculum aurantiacum]
MKQLNKTMIKQIAACLFIAFTIASCAKETIAGAMLEAEEQIANGSTISMSYQVNGALVKTTVNDRTNFAGSYHKLSCKKDTYTINNTDYYRYALSLVSTTGELSFLFYTDSLQAKTYVHKGSFGNQHFLEYNNTNGYTRYATDSMSFTITSYANRRINGHFSGKLTPLVGGTSNTYGTPGSIMVTNGTFENVPVFY